MNQNWIEEFIEAHGRPPRILHVGNIANNAYQNAKMLNAAGADCDVLSADYYHFMGCPEWDDAEITGDIGNEHYPAWHRVDLHGFERPRWFIQAPRRIAIAYLVARRKGDAKAAEELWRASERISRYYSYRENSALKKPLLGLEKLVFSAMALVRRLTAPKVTDVAQAAAADNSTPAQTPLTQRLNRDAAAFFPDRAIHFDTGWDSDYTAEEAALYRPLFELYDVVQGYATDCIWPYLTGFENYTAFEHGTLRHLPLEDNPTAHLTLLAYANAKAITVTNIDCYDNAKTIAKHAGTHIVCGLHGINMASVIEKIDAMQPVEGLDGRFGIEKDMPLFYCPSRHSYEEKLRDYIKGEDRAIRAAARLAREGGRFKLVLANWGDSVGKIKALLATLPELDDIVVWAPPLAKHDFYKSLLSVDAVIDQFYCRVYGGITFEVLCASHAILISSKPASDEDALRFFGRLLPYYGCNEDDEIYEAMKKVLEQPEQAAALAHQGREWILQCHSAPQIVAKNCEAFAQCTVETQGEPIYE